MGFHKLAIKCNIFFNNLKNKITTYFTIQTSLIGNVYFSLTLKRNQNTYYLHNQLKEESPFIRKKKQLNKHNRQLIDNKSQLVEE